MDEICEGEKQSFQDFPGNEMVLDHTKNVLNSLCNEKSLKEIQRFCSAKVVMFVSDQSMGIEVH